MEKRLSVATLDSPYVYAAMVGPRLPPIAMKL